MRVMILGGYGVFGGRLAHLLADRADLELLVCGRSREKAERFSAAFPGPAKVAPIAIDRSNLANRLSELAPDLVVDASGPFQNYGKNAYSVVEACITNRIDYCDFADGADFVFGVSQYDEAARAAGVFVLSGVSSFPVLTAAVVRELAREMDQVRTIRAGIAPSPHAGIGLNVMRAVTGYAGSPVKLTRGGRLATGLGLAESIHHTIAPPGRLPLRNIRFSLVDVPDLQVVPPDYPGLEEIWIGAGPVPEILHRMLNLLAKARARLNLPSILPLAPLFYRVLNLMKFGEHRGGMFVEVTGTRDRSDVLRSWHMLAEGDDGPLIPSMAAEAIIRGCLEAKRPETGARPATHALELSDYDALFAKRTIVTGFRGPVETNAPLYRRILGSAFDDLSKEIRRFHDAKTPQLWSGRAIVERGRNPLARFIGKVIGLPPAGNQVPVSVTVEQLPDGGERWERCFGEKRFVSWQRPGIGRDIHLLRERFGPIDVAVALVVEDGRLNYLPRRWSFFKVPMPRALRPADGTFETVADGRFRFDVTMRAPIVGLIGAYRGWLEPDAPTDLVISGISRDVENQPYHREPSHHATDNRDLVVEARDQIPGH
ncbi:DUF4166 domain-containing protein [Fulvimarina sp. MAC8]|uniref:DUF4166 domain-containing protein n=1 Tax=Fulvimarina sp. MAC8 TaxID=3162874 RepID=UPI0032EF416F